MGRERVLTPLLLPRKRCGDFSQERTKPGAENVRVRQWEPPAGPPVFLATIGRVALTRRPLLGKARLGGLKQIEVPPVKLRSSRGDVVHSHAEVRDDAGLDPGFFPDFSPYGVSRRLTWFDASRRHLHARDV